MIFVPSPPVEMEVEDRLKSSQRCNSYLRGEKVVVYVLIMNVEIDRGEVDKFHCWLDVAGFLPKNSKDVMDFVTELFNSIKFDYMFVDNELLSVFGYFVSELSRDKAYLATIPLNTYYIGTDWRSTGVEPVDLFVDVGSPFKHIYYVIKEATQNVYSIVGLSKAEHVEIYVEFFANEKDFCQDVWHPCDPQAIAQKVKDSAIHVEVNPQVNPLLSEYIRRLFTET